jgi:hypothetical protein
MHDIKIQDEPAVLELAVVGRPGRKRKLTDAIFEKIMLAIEDGDRVNIACRKHAISERTLYVKVSRYPESAKRFAEAKQIRLQKWHEEWLGEMCEHSKRSPWATGFLLERNFPKLYALKTVIREDGTKEEAIYHLLTHEQIVDSIRRAKEIEAQAPAGWQPLPEASGA